MRPFLVALLSLGVGSIMPAGNPTALQKAQPDPREKHNQNITGSPQTFWVRVPNDTFGRPYQYMQRLATLKRIGKYCYLYVGDSLSLADSLLTDLQAAYDAVIYPSCQFYFGKEWNPGIDGDSLVTILLEKRLKPDYYFSPYDEMADTLAQTKGHRSNEKEMIYIGRPNNTKEWVKGAMAHCQEHLIHWYQNPPGEAWLDEACAMYATDLCGYGAVGVDLFARNPNRVLTSWPSGIVDHPAPPEYGMYYAFLAYLNEKYPGKDPRDPMLRHLVARRDLNLSFISSGFMNVAAALWETGGPPSFVDPFTRWTVANFVNDTILSDPLRGASPGAFGYRKPLGGFERFQVQPTYGPPYLFATFPDSAFLEISWYGQCYIDIPKGSYDLSIELVQDTAIYRIEGTRYTQFVYRGYVVTSNTSNFLPGTNTIQPITFPTSLGAETLNFGPDIKRIRIIPSLPQYYQGASASPKFYVFAYTPFNPNNMTISRSPYVFPNPFNPEREHLHFRYVLPEASQVDIRVYDAAGNQIAVIANQQETPSGIYNSQAWDGRNYRGIPVANGVYFGRMKIGKATTGVKIAVMR